MSVKILSLIAAAFTLLFSVAVISAGKGHAVSGDNVESSEHGEQNKAEMPASTAATKVYENYKKPEDAELRKMLSKLQYDVTQKDATERPFKNSYWDNKQEGIYVDIVSGEPLFSSTHKYKSGTGWPSFYQPIDADFIATKTDYHLFYPRTELRSRFADSHLGHVFNDGPAPTGKRYCINSASLRFIAKADMEKEGYGDYLYLFTQSKG